MNKPKQTSSPRSEANAPCLDPSVRKKPQYFAGRKAFAEGTDVDNCPVAVGDGRIAWLTGWYDARTYSRVGNILDR